MSWVTRGFIVLWMLMAFRVGYLIYTFDGESKLIVFAIALRAWGGGLLSAYLLYLFINRKKDKQ